MPLDLVQTFHIAGAGMKAQSDRLRVISENIANADSTGSTPGAQPYRRKVITFKSALDRELGYEVVQSSKISADPSEFIKKYDPGHPAADAEGYVQYPNVNPMVEMVDLREAQRSYEANLNVIEASKAMLQQTISLLR